MNHLDMNGMSGRLFVIMNVSYIVLLNILRKARNQL